MLVFLIEVIWMVESQLIQSSVDIIQQVGFPIVAFLLMWYSHNTTLKKLTVALQELKTSLSRNKSRR